MNQEFEDIFSSLKTFVLDESQLEPIQKTNQSGIFNPFYGKYSSSTIKRAIRNHD
jgi:hypothetical protein